MSAAPARGFTLFELMLVLAIAGVLVGVGLPSLTQFVRANQLTSAANDMLTAIHLARAEAVKRRLPTQMCFTTTPNATTPACDGNGTQGWVVWVDDANPDVVDATNDGNGAVNANEPIILRHDALPGAISLVSKPASNAGFVAFMDTGFARLANNDIAGVVLCSSKGNTAQYGAQNSTARGLLISAVGRPSITRVVNTIATDANLLNNGSCP